MTSGLVDLNARVDAAHRPVRGEGDLLVLRALGLDDLLTAVPVLRALRRAHPGSRLVLAAPARLTGPAAATGEVDALLPTTAARREVPERLPWVGPPPLVGIDLHGSGPSTHRLVQQPRPHHTWAFAHPETPDIAGPRWRSDEHERARWCRLVAAYGITADPDDVAIPRPSQPSSRPGTVVVHPGADAPARCWPAARFGAVARAVAASGASVTITAGARERGLARRVAHLAGLGPEVVLTGAGRRGGDVDFGELAAVVAEARVVVSGDTGLAHLASALGTPSVVLFGPVAPALWGPPARDRHRVLWHPGPPGDPHAATTDPSLLRIEVDEVLAALAPALGHRIG